MPHDCVNAEGTRILALCQHAVHVGDDVSRFTESGWIRGDDELEADETDRTFKFGRPGCRGKQHNAGIQKLRGTKHYKHVHDVRGAQDDGRPGAQPKLLCKIVRKRYGPLPDLVISEAGVDGREQAFVWRRLATLFYPPHDG